MDINMIDNATVTLTVKDLKNLVKENTKQNLKEVDESIENLIRAAALVCETIEGSWYVRDLKHDTTEERIGKLKTALLGVRI